jgi:hypothetical protein
MSYWSGRCGGSGSREGVELRLPELIARRVVTHFRLELLEAAQCFEAQVRVSAPGSVLAFTFHQRIPAQSQLEPTHASPDEQRTQGFERVSRVGVPGDSRGAPVGVVVRIGFELYTLERVFDVFDGLGKHEVRLEFVAVRVARFHGFIVTRVAKAEHSTNHHTIRGPQALVCHERGTSVKPRVIVKRAPERSDLRLLNPERVAALRQQLTLSTLEPRAQRVTRWAALGVRTAGAFVCWALPNHARLMALHGLNTDGMPRNLPKKLELVFGDDFVQTRALSDLEEVAALLGTPNIPGFFASAPIKDGVNLLGALCVVDAQPRQLEANAQQLLGELAQSLIEHPTPSPSSTPTPAPNPEDLERTRVRHLGQHLPVLLFSVNQNGLVRHVEGPLIAKWQRRAETFQEQNVLERFQQQPGIVSALVRALNGETLQTNLEWHKRLYHVWLVPATKDDQPDGLTGLALDITDFQPETPTMQGRLEEIGGGVSLVQMIALTQPHGAIRFGGSAWLYLHNGRIVHAEHPKFEAERAVQEMLGYEKGSFMFDATMTPKQHTLSLNPTSIALEMARIADEKRNEPVPPPSSGFVVLPNVHAALEFVRGTGGAQHFNAQMQTSSRWTGERLVLSGRGLTIVVVQGNMDEVPPTMARGERATS